MKRSGFKWKPTWKGFKPKSFEQKIASIKRFSKGKSNHRKDKDRWNAEWKRDHAHIKFCWSCGQLPGDPSNPITQMHALKQRFILTREDSRRAAWVCWREHQPYDEGKGDDTHGRMAEFVDGLIEKSKSFEFI